MFSNMELHDRLQGIVENAQSVLGHRDQCQCSTRLSFDEYIIGDDVLCEVMFRIDGYVILFVEARFADQVAAFTLAEYDSSTKRLTAKSQREADNMCDVVADYVDRKIDAVLKLYQDV